MDTREMAKILGRRGGRVRASRLSVEQRKRIASLGGHARHRAHLMAQRVIDNFLYADAVTELQGEPPAVTRMKTFEGPLPGIYRESS